MKIQIGPTCEKCGLYVGIRTRHVDGIKQTFKCAIAESVITERGAFSDRWGPGPECPVVTGEAVEVVVVSPKTASGTSDNRAKG